MINNKDGYITASELKKGIQSLNSRTDAEIEEIMNSIDTDKNGAINYNEFIAATLNEKVASDYQRIIKAFEFFDINKDGMIDEFELKNSLAGKEFEKIDMNIFTDALHECDLNGDGKISLEEFMGAMEFKLNEKTGKYYKDSSLDKTQE